MDNAIRHDRSQVVLSIEPAAGSHSLHVDDDGSGVAPEDRSRIFERFTRLDEARTRDDGGSGLGLAIVAELADALGGSVTVSDSSTGGARFTLTLLAVAGEDQPTSIPSRRGVQSNPSHDTSATA